VLPFSDYQQERRARQNERETHKNIVSGRFKMKHSKSAFFKRF
jgi:hypothetical protein